MGEGKDVNYPRARSRNFLIAQAREILVIRLVHNRVGLELERLHNSMCYRCNEDQKFVRVKKEVKKRSLDLWLQLQLGGVNNIDIRQEEIMGHAVVQWVFVSL